MKEIILINITGKDKPGLTAHLTLILAAYKVTILDIGQAVIHDYLSLGMLIEIPEAHKSSAVLKELLFAAHKIGISVQFTPIEESRYEAWALQSGINRLLENDPVVRNAWEAHNKRQQIAREEMRVQIEPKKEREENRENNKPS